MLKIIKYSFGLYIVFLGVVSYFYLKNGFSLFSSNYLSVFFPITLIFVIFFFVLFFMGRNGNFGTILGSYDKLTEIRKDKLRRVWIVVSWGFDEKGIFFTTFGKRRGFLDFSEIKSIYAEEFYLNISAKNVVWQIVCDDNFSLEKKLKEIKKNL